jgi:hypothetical protein
MDAATISYYEHDAQAVADRYEGVVNTPLLSLNSKGLTCNLYPQKLLAATLSTRLAFAPVTRICWSL